MRCISGNQSIIVWSRAHFRSEQGPFSFINHHIPDGKPRLHQLRLGFDEHVFIPFGFARFVITPITSPVLSLIAAEKLLPYRAPPYTSETSVSAWIPST